MASNERLFSFTEMYQTVQRLELYSIVQRLLNFYFQQNTIHLRVV